MRTLISYRRPEGEEAPPRPLFRRAVYVYQAFGRLYAADWREYEAFVAAFGKYADDERRPPEALGRRPSGR